MAPQPFWKPQSTVFRPGVARDGMDPRILGLLNKLEEAKVVPQFEITSGYRDPDRNARVGGAKGSKHIDGIAADISTKGWTDDQRSAFLEAAIRNGAKGVGIYPNGSFHFDVRDTPAAWGPKGYGSSDVNTFPEWARKHITGLLGQPAGTPGAPAALPKAAPGQLADAGVSPLPQPQGAVGGFNLFGPANPSPTPDAAAASANPLKGLSENKGAMEGIDGLLKGLGGGQKQQQQSTPMPGPSNFGSELAARMAPAQALMAQLLASKQKTKGLLG